ncbi:hypothetical protein ACFW9N_34965 [Streptomyces sp. NPDC059496]
METWPGSVAMALSKTSCVHSTDETGKSMSVMALPIATRSTWRSIC